MRHSFFWVATSLWLSCVPQVNDLPCARDENCPGTAVCVCAVCVEVDAGVRPSCGVDGGRGGGAGGVGGGAAAGGTAVDAGLTDAGRADAGEADAGQPDAGGPDASTSDAGVFDAGVDAGPTCSCSALEVCVANVCQCGAGAAREGGACVPVLESLTVSHPQGVVPLTPVFDALGTSFTARMRFDASVTLSATSLSPDASISVSSAAFTDASVPYTSIQSASFTSLSVRVSLGGVDRQYGVNVTREFPVQTSFKSAGLGLSADAGAGSSIAVSNDGNVLVVGLPALNRAEVFVRNATQWLGPFSLAPGMTIDLNDEFGKSVATNDDGTLVVVGAPGDDGLLESVTNSGAAYVFRRNVGGPGGGTTFSFVNQLKGHYVRANDAFGTSVALSGNGYTLLVGVPGDDGVADGGPALGVSNSGAATVFADDGGVFMSVRNLKAPNPGADDGFGTSVAIANDGWLCPAMNVCNNSCSSAQCPSTQGLRYVVGAPFEDSATATSAPMGAFDEAAQNAGAVYVFSGTPYAASVSAYLKRPTAQPGANFGASVAISRRWGAIAVGAPNDNSGAAGIATGTAIATASMDNTMPSAGSVTIFEPTHLVARYAKFAAPQAGDRLGASVALGADQYVLAAGAPGANGSSGAVLYSALTSNPRARLLLPPFPDANDEFGASVAISGFVLTFVGSPGEDSAVGGINSGAGLSGNGLSNSGAVFLHVD
ncbi:MAG: hypothetical protein JNM69_11430 [Archangium sp.]|nr:hypothetical protein [Archangium sp.]